MKKRNSSLKVRSLQRDLDACDVFVCGSLIERENEVIDNDVEMLETNEFEEGNWKQPISDFNCNINNDNNSCNQCLDYDWPWGTLVNTSNDTMQVECIVPYSSIFLEFILWHYSRGSVTLLRSVLVIGLYKSI